jgi:hypothetical protein
MSKSKRKIRRTSPRALVIGPIPVIVLVVISLVAHYPLDFTAIWRGALDLTICDTAYAKDFSVRAFREIGPGDTLASVKDLIGEPITEYRVGAYSWGYRDAEAATIRFAFDRNDDVLSSYIASWDDETQKQIGDKIHSLGTSAEVERVYGKPSWKEAESDSVYLHYSRTPSSTHYWHYFVVLDPYTNLVLDTSDEFYYD